MKGYSCDFDVEGCASARLEGVDASYKDLSEVCGRIRRKDAAWARVFLERVAEGEIPVLYKRHNKKLGHRRELGGRKGRYPWKCAAIVLKVLNSAIANGMAKGLGEGYVVFGAAANKKFSYPRMAPKGRTARSYYELARIEIVLKPTEAQVPKGVEVKKAKTDAKPADTKKAAEKKPEQKSAEASAGAGTKKEESKTPTHSAAPHVHKHEQEREREEAHAHQAKFEYVHSRAKRTEIK